MTAIYSSLSMLSEVLERTKSKVPSTKTGWSFRNSNYPDWSVHTVYGSGIIMGSILCIMMCPLRRKFSTEGKLIRLSNASLNRKSMGHVISQKSWRSHRGFKCVVPNVRQPYTVNSEEELFTGLLCFHEHEHTWMISSLFKFNMYILITELWIYSLLTGKASVLKIYISFV